MRRLTLVGAIYAVLVTPVAALAITNGTATGSTSYQPVGAVLRDSGGTLKLQCSGTLVAPTIVITAAHCAYGSSGALLSSTVYVSFDAALPATHAVKGTLIPNPGFNLKNADTKDLAVIRLSVPQTITPAKLPTAGLLAAAKISPSAVFPAVGFGYASPTTATDTREVAGSGFGTLGTYHLNLKENQAFGGACYGDSGGPVFMPGTLTVVATSSTGDSTCTVATQNYRLDTASARSFLSGYVTLP